MLRDRQRETERVDLLERVRADHRARHLARDRDERNRVELRVGDRREQVRGAGARRRDADAGPARHACDALGDEARALLVAREHVTNRARSARARRTAAARRRPEFPAIVVTPCRSSKRIVISAPVWRVMTEAPSCFRRSPAGAPKQKTPAGSHRRGLLIRSLRLSKPGQRASSLRLRGRVRKTARAGSSPGSGRRRCRSVGSRTS